uniref:Uncharacterized protein n=1 Tax=Chromera velia CCMP2878 TaxID=1169474 RepID=A0A0G4HYK0_9ALVE|eukprot:Cvel_1530.t1-p1 / transcript=Cvel_1530.t1 / gene=Cvel_1530 / organism=Chromera_velia_CCMP2878 / gene_product=hypothetical protein / transcript_product=hypothetical protein / location=Cvel_scaffold54:36194-39609(-) / protein_length=291 / sequence_SO=supercontig / SO=protein_coding / is_pseudo=false
MLLQALLARGLGRRSRRAYLGHSFLTLEHTKSNKVDCDGPSLGYSLRQNPLSELDEDYVFSVDKKRVAVLMRDYKHLGKGGNHALNCFAFSTRQRRQIPGTNLKGKPSPVSMPMQVTEKNLKKAMDMEGALFLGRDLRKIDSRVVEKAQPDKKYFLVLAFLITEEYHFWGLFGNGWWTKPSKVGSVMEAPLGDSSAWCPSESVFMRLRRISPHKPYRPKEGGFFLFPCKADCGTSASLYDEIPLKLPPPIAPPEEKGPHSDASTKAETNPSEKKLENADTRSEPADPLEQD